MQILRMLLYIQVRPQQIKCHRDPIHNKKCMWFGHSRVFMACSYCNIPVKSNIILIQGCSIVWLTSFNMFSKSSQNKVTCRRLSKYSCRLLMQSKSMEQCWQHSKTWPVLSASYGPSFIITQHLLMAHGYKTR